MALTRSIPIKNKIFSDAALVKILELVSKNYKKPKGYDNWASYRLSIRKDATTIVTLDEPPKKFEPLLNEKMRSLSLRVDSDKPRKYIEVEIYHGSASLQSQIVVHGEAEEWVNATHREIENVLDHVGDQSTAVRRFYFPFLAGIALMIGWPLKSLLFYWMLCLGAAKLVPWSSALLVQHLLTAFGIGTPIAMLLLEYIKDAYPSVEIQTGPPKYWLEANRRRRLIWVSGFLLVAPSADLLYDLYRQLV